MPVVLSSPGRVGADTKTYLYLDPGKLLRRAVTMWDPNVGMGTVTHQTIGYLFPMGPYYWSMERLGVPDWAAQRIWIGTILFAAGAGVLFLCRTLAPHWTGAGPLVAAAAYELSPYSLHYAARISVILLPWAALGWMIGLAVRATRTGSWRHPAAFALVVTIVGGVNATSLFLAGLGPLLWFPFAVWGSREVRLREALAVAARIGLLTTLASLWWLSGLWAQSQFGINVLRYTETPETVARTSTAPEVLRGLGYWFFYGNDKVGPWIEPGRQYTQQVWLIAVGFAVPVLALVAAGVTRWRYRAYFVLLVAVGALIAVGAYPYEQPAPFGAAFKSFATSSTAGLALRSTPRAVPLVLLGLATLLGGGVTALGARTRRATLPVAAAVVALVAAGLPPLFTGDLPIASNLDRPEEVPGYWLSAARYLDERGVGTRVLEIPGTDFASYRWGNTVDPITPFLMDRPYVARELIPYGSEGTADLLNAMDRRMQEGIFEADAVAPVARLMAAGDVVLRGDLQHERFRTPRPQVLWLALTNPRPPGLGRPVGFGPTTPNKSIDRFPLLDEIALAIGKDAPQPPRVAAFPVEAAQPILRAYSAARPIVIAGSGEGVVDLAAAGVDLGRAPLFYAASFAGDAAALESLIDAGADLVVTDSNRLQARRWGTVRENLGLTEALGDEPLEEDPADARLPLFPNATDNSFTVAERRGIARVSATHYGNPVSYTPEDRPFMALDADPETAWRVGAFADVEGERIRVELEEPVTTDGITLLQPITGPRNRFITTARISLDGATPFQVQLDARSREGKGQTIPLGPARTFSTVEVEVRETNIGKRARYDGVSGVGIAELGIPGVVADEVIRLPRDLLDAAGDAAASRRLTVVMTRQRTNPSEPVRTDEERFLARVFDLPATRSFDLRGTARISAHAPDDVIDRLVGLPGRARSSGRLPGDVRARASSAFDGDPATAWMPGLGPQEGGWLEIDLPRPTRLDRMRMDFLSDGRYSVPTRLRLDGDGQQRVVDVIDNREVTFDPFTARTVRITVEAVAPTRTVDYFSEQEIDLPVAIAEVQMPGVPPQSAPEGTFDSGCRSDLLDVNGSAIPVRVTGTVDEALDRDGLSLSACRPEVAIAAGEAEVRSAAGRATGIDVDRVVLDAPGIDSTPPASAPNVRRSSEDRTSASAQVSDHGGRPFWFVLSQSYNRGWSAKVDGRDLGAPTLVNGYANGWLIDPESSGPVTVELDWRPQRVVSAALVASAAALVVCLLVLVAGALRSRRRQEGSDRADVRGVPTLDLRLRGAHIRPRRAIAAIALVGVFALGAAGPVVAGVTLGAGVVALLPRLRRLPAVLAPVALAAAGTYTAVQQYRHGYPPDFSWPLNFDRVHIAGWLAVALLALDAALRARPGAESGDGGRGMVPGA